MLTRRLLPLAAAFTLLVGGPAVAIAAPPGGECPPGQDKCWVVDDDEGEGGNDGGNNGGNNGGGDRECTRGGAPIACYDEVFGWFNQSDECYYKLAEPQLDPPEGAITGAYYSVTCAGGAPDNRWIEGAPPTAPDPVTLALRARAGITLRGPDIQIRPDANGAGLVGLPVWLWVDKSEETWGPNENSAADGGLVVEITASVTRLTFDLGDGTTIDCSTSGGTPYPTGATGPSPDCGHVYTKSSRKQPGQKFTITATATWTVNWESSSGERGTLAPEPQESTASVRINELQVVTE
jgi:hypothetical protein